MSKISEKQKQYNIISAWYRTEAQEMQIDRQDFLRKMSVLSEDELKRILPNLINGNRQTNADILRKFSFKKAAPIEENNELKEQVKKALNLQDITEINKDGAEYFKFKDANGDVFVVKNMGNDSKELFTSILNNTNVTNSQNGKQNTSEIFKFLKDNKFIEVGLTKSTNIDGNSYDNLQMKALKAIEKKYPDREVVASIAENIYIVKGNTTDEDIVLHMVMIDGKPKLKPLTQKTYGTKIGDESKKEDNSIATEIPNDIMIEIENNEEIINIIDEGININIPDENIKNSAIATINTKYPKFSAIPNIGAIITALIARRRLERENRNQSNSLQNGRQFVYTIPSVSNSNYNNQQVA